MFLFIYKKTGITYGTQQLSILVFEHWENQGNYTILENMINILNIFSQYTKYIPTWNLTETCIIAFLIHVFFLDVLLTVCITFCLKTCLFLKSNYVNIIIIILITTTTIIIMQVYRKCNNLSLCRILCCNVFSALR